MAAAGAMVTPIPRTSHTAIWTGSEMIVWGGNDNQQVFANDGFYTPDFDTWTGLN